MGARTPGGRQQTTYRRRLTATFSAVGLFATMNQRG